MSSGPAHVSSEENQRRAQPGKMLPMVAFLEAKSTAMYSVAHHGSILCRCSVVVHPQALARHVGVKGTLEAAVMSSAIAAIFEAKVAWGSQGTPAWQLGVGVNDVGWTHRSKQRMNDFVWAQAAVMYTSSHSSLRVLWPLFSLTPRPLYHSANTSSVRRFMNTIHPCHA